MPNKVVQSAPSPRDGWQFTGIVRFANGLFYEYVRGFELCYVAA